MKKIILFSILIMLQLSNAQNNAFTFNGIDQQIATYTGQNNVQFKTQDFTFEAWVKPAAFVNSTGNFEHTISAKDNLLAINNILYVKQTASGTGDGSSWANASNNLQAMINLSLTNGQVWVATGNYYPDRDITNNLNPINSRNKTFSLKNDVALYGGFAGTETNLSQQNTALYPTILNGDIGIGNDITDNVYNVVTSINNNVATSINGFKIINGNNLPIVFSIADGFGGGMYASNSSLQVKDCTFSENFAGRGPAAYIVNSSNITFFKCVVQNNSNTTVGNFIDGGGIFFDNSQSCLISNCAFIENKGNGFVRGGALLLKNNTSVTITNSIFYNNVSRGCINLEASSATISNCTFYNNINKFYHRNIQSIGGSTIILNNSILIREPVFFDITANPSEITASNIITNDTVIYPGTNNAIGTIEFNNVNNPAGNDGIFFTDDDGFRLRETDILAIDSGNNTTAQSSDILGNAIYNTTRDLGAYEFIPSPCDIYSGKLYVNKNATGLNNGTTWANAYTDLTSALTNNCENEVWVAAGTYKPTADANGCNTCNPLDFTFVMKTGKKVYGGFIGTETALNQRNSTDNPLILSADTGIVNQSNDNARIIIKLENTTNYVLDGIIFKDCSSGSTNQIANSALWSKNASGTVENCTFTNNNRCWTGVLLFEGGKTFLNKCVIEKNNSTNQTLDLNGSLIRFTSAEVTISNSVISKCSSNANDYGMIMPRGFSKITFFNTLFDQNTTSGSEKLIFTTSVASIDIINCIFNTNISSNGIFRPFSSGSIHNVYNSIFWDNSSVGGAFTFNNCNAEIIFGGTNNISVAPNFLNVNNPIGADNKWFTADDGLQLLNCSALLDAGNNASYNLTAFGNKDILGNPRIQNTTIAIGAYETPITNLVNNEIVTTSCNASSYTWAVNNQTYTTSGTYSFVGDCSTYNLNLIFPASTENITNINTCSNYTWANTGQTYTQSGTYTGTTTNCVTEKLNLTITPSTDNVTTLVTCGSFNWLNTGQTYTQSGIYIGSTTNCITEKLNLTINPSTIEDLFVTACGSYNWQEADNIYTVSGNYSLQTAVCTTKVLHLTITQPTDNTTSIAECNNYYWANTNTTYTQSGIYTGSTTNCVTEKLNLTILPLTQSVITITECETFTWANTGQTYTQSGIYTGLTSNCNTEMLDLTITGTSGTTFFVNGCDSYTWAIDGQTYTQTGFYPYLHTPGNGCTDYYLNLTMNTTQIVTGNATQNISSTGTVADIVVSPSNVVWYLTEADALSASNAILNSFPITTASTYYAVANNGSCASVPFVVNVNLLGNQDFDATNFSFYPNPTNGIVTIKYSKEISNVSVTNLLGQVLLDKKITSNECQIDLSNFPVSTYFIKIIADGKSKIIKIIKE